MSAFNETITLTNIMDRARVECGGRKDIRSVTLEACVDTGSWNLVLNEEVRAKLGLKLEGMELAELADGTIEEYPMTEPVEFHWKDRTFALPAQVIPAANEVLFGALPMESLDVSADPVDECLVGRHGDKRIHRLKSVRKPADRRRGD